MKKLSFYTHGGFFHADEVTAYAICRRADVATGVVRLTDLNNIPDDGIVADIGREYNPARLRFDHHQGLIWRETNQHVHGIPYASAGLIWKEFGRMAIMRQLPGLARQQARLNAIHQRVDETLIQGVDAHDADNAYQISATCSGGKSGHLRLATSLPE